MTVTTIYRQWPHTLTKELRPLLLVYFIGCLHFKRNQHENLKDLARFFKEYAPRYGYKYLCTEDADYKYYQTLGLKLIHRGFFRQYNYGLLLKELEI